jgi:cysteine-rich repeat protein
MKRRLLLALLTGSIAMFAASGCELIVDFDREKIPVCGDGETEAPEECDDSNTTNGDGCSSECEEESADMGTDA